MFNQSTALLAVNNTLLFNNQNLFQGLYSLGVQIRNKSSINTKESFLVELQNYRPTFAILSSNLAGVIGLSEVLSKAKQISPMTKIVLIASDSDKGSVNNYFMNGISSIIWAENARDCLEFAVKQAKKGEQFLCGKALNDMKESVQKASTQSPSDHAQLTLLTDREIEVLHALTKGTNYKQISKELFISESTVKTHVNNIFTKLNVNDRTQAVLYALNHGISSLIKNPDIIRNALKQKV